MPKLFFSNFDFEDELAGRRTHPAALKSLQTSLSKMWSAIAEPGDRLYDHYPGSGQTSSATVRKDSDHSALGSLGLINEHQLANSNKQFELVPWGWSPSCLTLAEQFALTTRSPELSCVRTINDRIFGFDYECEASIGLDGATSIRSENQLVSQVNTLVRHATYCDAPTTTPWIVKSHFSAAGRHCLRGQGPPTERQLAWVRKRIGRAEVLFLEPIVDRVREAGFQFWIDDRGARFDGCVEMLCDRNGQFRASVVTPSTPPEWAESLVHCTQLAQRIQGMGYFGPLGIDAMQYRQPDGQQKQRPIQDVNGRFTMGRMALSLKQALSDENEVAIWLHCDCDPSNSPETLALKLKKAFPLATRILPTSTLPQQSGKAPFLVVLPPLSDLATVLISTENMFGR